MTEPLSDRLLDALGDPVARSILKTLERADLSQLELIERLELPQATVSRTLKLLRALGLVTQSRPGRGVALSLTVADGTSALFLAADRLAEEVLKGELQAQREESADTRRRIIRPVEGGEATHQ